VKRRQYVAGAAGVLAGLAGCVDTGPDPDGITPYDFSVQNWGAADVVEVRMTRGGEPVFETELEMAPGETWAFEGQPRVPGTLTVIVVANGYSGVRGWSNPDGAGVLRADVREDGIEFSASTA
jgi:hypothetical protein